MSPSTRKQIRQLEQELITEFVPAISRPEADPSRSFFMSILNIWHTNRFISSAPDDSSENIVVGTLFSIAAARA